MIKKDRVVPMRDAEERENTPLPPIRHVQNELCDTLSVDGSTMGPDCTNVHSFNCDTDQAEVLLIYTLGAGYRVSFKGVSWDPLGGNHLYPNLDHIRG